MKLVSLCYFVVGIALLAWIEYNVSASNLTPKEMSLFIFMQGAIIGFFLLVLAGGTYLNERIKRLEKEISSSSVKRQKKGSQ